jgi:hypothetical protein
MVLKTSCASWTTREPKTPESNKSVRQLSRELAGLSRVNVPEKRFASPRCTVYESLQVGGVLQIYNASLGDRRGRCLDRVAPQKEKDKRLING